MIHNPILRGFNPDPSIVLVGDDYYIATSTFEWFPGIQIHHSRDLRHWRLLTRPLNRLSQLDLRGVGASQGVWAPCLTWDRGTFYLVYTVVTAFYCNMYDTHNYIVTAPDITGPWSEPAELSGFGFDPSLFHDDDGRKYMVCMVTDHRVPKKYAGRLIVQEYDPAARRMTGEPHEIYQAKDIFLEGPHIFKRNGWYYLFCADTGTGEAHGQTMLRARHIFGPYEMDRPDFGDRTSPTEAYSLLTSRHVPEHPLQKSGHADLVQTQQGDWYIVHLCARPLPQRNPENAPRFAGCRRYMLGRETALQRVVWTEDGWLRLHNGTHVPDAVLPDTGLPPCPWPAEPERDDFDAPQLPMHYQFLRLPLTGEDLSLTARPGWLRLYGQESMLSLHRQAMAGTQIDRVPCVCETLLDCHPTHFLHAAGLSLWYHTANYYAMLVTWDEELGRCLRLVARDCRRTRLLHPMIPLPEGDIALRMTLTPDHVAFAWAMDGTWHELPMADAPSHILSDEYANRSGDQGFTGCFAALCCQDQTGEDWPADFRYLTLT